MSDRSTIIKIINQILSGSKKITELTEIVSATNDDWVEIVQAGVNYKIKKSNLVVGGVGAFTDLSDVPGSYVGQAGKLVQVKATEDGLEFVTSGASFALTDGLGTTANGTAVDLGGNFDAGPITIENSANQPFTVVSADPGVQYGTVLIDPYSAQLSITNDANTEQNGFFLLNQDSPEISDDFNSMGLKGRADYSSGITASDVTYYAQIGYLNTWVGSTNITTVGTITTGTWNADRLAADKTPQGSARSVWGVTGNATADQASIQGAANQVLRVNSAGTALAFGTIGSANADETLWKVGGNTLSGAAILGSTSAQDITMTVGNANYKLAVNGTQVLSVSAALGWLFDSNGGTIAITTAYDFRARSGDTRVVRFANQTNQTLWTLGFTNGEMFMGTSTSTFIGPGTRNSVSATGTGIVYRASSSGGHYFLIGATNMGAYSQIDFGTTAGDMVAVSSTTGQWIRSRPSFSNTTTQTSVSYTFFEQSPTINTTGGSTTLRAWDFNPTETALTGTTLYGITLGGTSWLSGFGTRTPTALVHIGASTTGRASLRIAAGVAPSSPNDGDIYYIDTNDRLMFYKNATASEIISASAVTTEALTSDTSLTITYNGTTYKLLARA